MLVGLSLIAVLVWQLRAATQVKEHGAQMRDQQVKLVDQSRRVAGGVAEIRA